MVQPFSSREHDLHIDHTVPNKKIVNEAESRTVQDYINICDRNLTAIAETKTWKKIWAAASVSVLPLVGLIPYLIKASEKSDQLTELAYISRSIDSVKKRNLSDGDKKELQLRQDKIKIVLEAALGVSLGRTVGEITEEADMKFKKLEKRNEKITSAYNEICTRIRNMGRIPHPERVLKEVTKRVIEQEERETEIGDQIRDQNERNQGQGLGPAAGVGVFEIIRFISMF